MNPGMTLPFRAVLLGNLRPDRGKVLGLRGLRHVLRPRRHVIGDLRLHLLIPFDLGKLLYEWLLRRAVLPARGRGWRNVDQW